MTKLKRSVSLLLMICLLFGVVMQMAPSANAYMAAKPLPALTGNKAQDVVNIALSQLGYHEVGGGTVYGAWWTEVTNWGTNYTKLGWCSMFANWCAHQAGAGMNIAYDKRSAVVSNSMSWLQNNAFADTTFKTKPQPGDFIYFGYGGSYDHVAIVVAYDSATNKVTFVGGNQGDAVTQFTMLYTKSAKYGSQTISGIGRPNYGGSAPVVSCTCSEGFAGYYKCVTSSDQLNIRGGHGTGFSVVGTIPSGATVYVSKAQGSSNSSWAHIEYNGIKGYASMEFLKRQSEYDMTVSYDDHSGHVDKVNVTVYDHVTADELELTIPEQLPVTSREADAPVIQVSAKDQFRLHLEIPLDSHNSGVMPVILHSNGTKEIVEYYEATDAGLRITVTGSARLQLINKAITFPDVPADHWARDSVDYLTSRGLMNGKLDGTFGQADAIQRRTVAMMLWRLAGEPQVTGTVPFTDVKQDRYFTAILWAYQNGIISGYSDNTFRPEAVISRQHFAAMLHRYTMAMGMGLPAVNDKDIRTFTEDYSQISSNMHGSVQWAVNSGIIMGRTDTRFDPVGATSRSQMAVILVRFLRANFGTV